MNNWDKVEQRKNPVTFTRNDEIWEYTKLFFLFFLAGGYMYLLFKQRNTMKKSPIDSLIVDLILEHYNIQAFNGRQEIITADEFMNIVEMAKKMYFNKIKKLTTTKIALA